MTFPDPGVDWRRLALTLLTAEREQAPELHPAYFVDLYSPVLTQAVAIERVKAVMTDYLIAWEKREALTTVPHGSVLYVLSESIQYFPTSAYTRVISNTFTDYNRSTLKSAWRVMGFSHPDLDGLLMLGAAVLNMILVPRYNDENPFMQAVTSHWVALTEMARIGKMADD